MKKYMIEVGLPEYLGTEFMALIPFQQLYINSLIEKGVISTYAVDADRSRGWIGMSGKSEEEIEKYLKKFPIFDYLTTYHINELMFFDSEAYRFPKLCLN